MELTIKFISQVNHVGSTEQTARRIAHLSKAAGKFNAMLGATIKEAPTANESSGPPAPEPTPGRRKSSLKDDTSKVVTKTLDVTPEQAAVIATTLFNAMEKESNSEKYTERKSNFDTAKRECLNELGARDFKELTPDQRSMYAKKMIARKAPFSYTERSIHIRCNGMATVYSKTHRKLGKSHWPDDIYDRLIPDLGKLMKSKEVRLHNVQQAPAKEPSQMTEQ